MSLITKAAYLKFCPRCGLHCVIVFADGTESEPFMTRVDGLLALSNAAKHGKIAPDEMQVVEDGICSGIHFSSREDKILVRTLAGLGLSVDDVDDLVGFLHMEGSPPNHADILPLMHSTMVS